MKIMIVDDHAAFRQLVRTLLPAQNLECVECDNGREAVARYASCRPDVVLMDLAMKDLDGLSATREIKARDPHARILIVSEYDDPALRASAQAAGAVGYLRKDDLSPLPAAILAQLTREP